MPLSRLIIKNFKSIKYCNISFTELNLLIGENGSGKTNLLEAINYFYANLTSNNISNEVFDVNNFYSNKISIALEYDLSDFVKIYKSNTDEIDRLLSNNDETKYISYYKSIYSIALNSKDNKIRLELQQIKGRKIHWNFERYEDRFVLKSLFPIFCIDTRNLDIEKWEYLWDIIGELCKTSNSVRNDFETTIIKMLTSEESVFFSNKYTRVIELFNLSNVSVKRVASKEYAKYQAKLLLSGEDIQLNDRNLKYYSTGTNSVKYIKLLLKSIRAIAETKLKEPIVLIDEPEIGLHARYLDEISDSIIDNNIKVCRLITTHSSRLIKNLVIKHQSLSLFGVKLLNNYSQIQQMKLFSQYSPRSNYRVSDDNINSYFSRAILFVEGETELELFSNPYLKILFPKLNSIDVFKAMSQTPILNIMNPKLNKLRTPYLCLIDMDKAIQYNRSNKKLILKKEFFDIKIKEKFQYRNKLQKNSYLYHLYKYLKRMESSLRIHYFLPYLSCKDPAFKTFLAAVHEYLLAYNIFSFNTTVEGALINHNTINHSLDFLQKKKPKTFSKFKTYWDSLGKTDQLNSLRMIYNGKSDLLQSRNTKDLLPQTDQEIISANVIGEKTSGWISDYLDSYFSTFLQHNESLSVKTFEKLIQKEDSKKNIQKCFQHDFPELHLLIETLCGMIIA